MPSPDLFFQTARAYQGTAAIKAAIGLDVFRGDRRGRYDRRVKSAAALRRFRARDADTLRFSGDSGIPHKGRREICVDCGFGGISRSAIADVHCCGGEFSLRFAIDGHGGFAYRGGAQGRHGDA